MGIQDNFILVHECERDNMVIVLDEIKEKMAPLGIDSGYNEIGTLVMILTDYVKDGLVNAPCEARDI